MCGSIYGIYIYISYMGVHQLWDILGPTARPVRLEALSRKKLAVDASIWIYQFLKAVRDPEGNAMKGSHIVGFFRRICKLLYFGIQPIFVFDGGAPALKRRTIQKRRERRQGKQETAEQAAQRLLSRQLQNLADGKVSKPVAAKKTQTHLEDNQYAEFYEDNAMFEQVGDKPAEKQEEKPFRKLDDYHLPSIKGFEYSVKDNRMITDYEYQRLTEEMEDDLGDLDLDRIDPKSQEFAELPLAKQYVILSHLRLRSRLRMGYTKEQLQNLFPQSMDFSKFQIQMVQKRNYLTQRLMNATGMDGKDGDAIAKRVSGERGKEYMLQKNPGGWTLSLGEGDSSRPIELDENGEIVKHPEDQDEDVEWEDVSGENVSGESAPQKNAKDDDLASIQSLYDLGFQNKRAKAESNNHADIQDIEEMELRQAVENSKQEYFQLKAHESMINEDPFLFEGVEKSQPIKQDVVAVPEFQLGKSFLVGSKSREQKEVEPKISDLDVDGIDEEFEPPKEEESRRAAPMPVWFNNKPHVEEKSSRDRRTEDEKLGLVSWEDVEDQEDQEDQEVAEDDFEDVEIVEQLPRQPISDVQRKKKPPLVLSKGSTKEEPHPKEKAPSKVDDYVFSESEEEAVVRQLEEEEEEHSRFVSSLKHATSSSMPMGVEDAQELRRRQRNDKRDADEVTQNMIQDVQDLLSRFGIPFITAPMEAEAQCAELLQLNLVDGIITDDSDCFLFGGERVYKNMFNEKNYVECYFGAEIERDLGLTREKLIQLALLLGSDYTEGIKGVGAVTAMEIMAEFKTQSKESNHENTLTNFRDWWIDYQNGKLSENETSLKQKLRKKFKNDLFLTKGFPDSLVFDAYLHPEVDSDPTEFKWGDPNLDSLRTFLMFSVGWSQPKVDETLVPVIKDMNKKRTEGTQTTLGEFFPKEFIQQRRELMMGQRLKDATKKLSQHTADGNAKKKKRVV